MTLLLWICSLTVMGLFLAAWREGRDAPADRWWSYPVQPAFAEVPVEPASPARPSARPALQTGVAILAVALAIDVSASPLIQFAPLEPEPAASVSASAYDFTPAQDSFPAYAPASWTLSASTTDGWFV